MSGGEGGIDSNRLGPILAVRAPSASKTLARFFEPMGSNSTNFAVTKEAPFQGPFQGLFVTGGGASPLRTMLSGPPGLSPILLKNFSFWRILPHCHEMT